MLNNRSVHLVLGGGGVKGISYIGVFEAAEQQGIRLGNIAGVSAGALSGAIASAGYPAAELKRVLNSLDFGKIDPGEVPGKIPMVSRFMAVENRYRSLPRAAVENFVRNELLLGKSDMGDYRTSYRGFRGNFFKNLIKICKEGSLFDGDYLEEWVNKVLAQRGIRTFGDLRGGISDRMNPKGYKIRMTAVDANRGRVIILPDDIGFYGIEPDELQVSKAVRMSTCVPFAFKPVELKKNEGGNQKTYHIVDGGVLDSLPYWLLNNPSPIPTVGFRFKEGKKKLLSLDTPLHIMKFFMSAMHDIGIPEHAQKPKYVLDIDTSKVSSLDFNLDEEEKEYLYLAGRDTALAFFKSQDFRAIGRYGMIRRFLRFFR